MPNKRYMTFATAAAMTVAGLAIAADSALLKAAIGSYAAAIGPNPEYIVEPLFSVGETVPETSNPANRYQMIGLPDGMGAHRNADGTLTVFLSHELTGSATATGGTQSEPLLGAPKNRGAFVSKFILSNTGRVLSGERAYDTVYINDTLVGPAAEVGNNTRPFARFCSASLAGPEHGFDRYIYFANEESSGSATFLGTGGLSVAIFDNKAFGLTHLGRFAWENTLAQPNPSGNRVVLMGMEDGPASQDPLQNNSQLYMYVGEKSTRPGATVLERNGLVGGTLYVFRAKNRHKGSELAFQHGTMTGEWVALPGASTLTDVQLEEASDLAGAMIFARPEDGAFNPRNNNQYFFVTTGGAAGANVLGRLYSLKLNPSDPTKDAVLTIEYNADAVVAAGGDIALSPDNIDTSGDYLMINEDGTAESRAVMAAKGRDGSIWRFDLKQNGVDVASAKRVVELMPPGRDGVAVGPGVWETSGIIDMSRWLGRDSWLFDVQAHSPTSAPLPFTVEDGQLLLMRRR